MTGCRRASLVTFAALAAFAALATLALSGCGKFFDNIEDNAGTTQGQTDIPENAGTAGVANVTISPNGNDLTILTLSSIQPRMLSTFHTLSNEISIHVALRAESEAYAAVHVRELEKASGTSGVISLDSALGCHYVLGNAGTARAYLTSVSGSCVNTLTVDLPDHDLPRTFLGAAPLFSGRIALDDVKAVFAAAPYDTGLTALLKTYVARLPEAERPVTVAELGAFMKPLAEDMRRLDAVATFAPRVLDPANAESLPADGFTNAATRARAVKIILAFQNKP